MVLKISSKLFLLLLSTVTCDNFLTGRDAFDCDGGGGGRGGGCKQRRAWRKDLYIAPQDTNNISHQTRQRPNTSRPISGKISFCTRPTLHFRFCIINLLLELL